MVITSHQYIGKYIGIKQSKVDKCVFYHVNVMYVLYTNNSILEGPDPKDIYQDIKEIKAVKLNITDEADIQDFLGVKIDCKPDGTIHTTQYHLIDQILDEIKMGKKMNTRMKDTPD